MHEEHPEVSPSWVYPQGQYDGYVGSDYVYSDQLNYKQGSISITHDSSSERIFETLRPVD
jgi:hypothetical protein